MSDQTATMQGILSSLAPDPLPLKTSAQASLLQAILYRELGLNITLDEILSCEEIEQLTDLTYPRLPRLEDGRSMVDLFLELRERIIDQGVKPKAWMWNTLWIKMCSYWDDLLCEEIYRDYDISDRMNYDTGTVAGTVRTLWHLNGGQPYWEEPAYEKHWCSTQAIFNDLRVLTNNINTTYRSTLSKWSKPAASQIAPRPDDMLSNHFSRDDHPCLLHLVYRIYNVWLGTRKAQEPWWVIYLVGILVFPGSAFAAMAVAANYENIPAWIVIIFAAIYVVSVILLARYLFEARLPKNIRTYRDLVYAIRDKRQTLERKPPRIRPVLYK